MSKKESDSFTVIIIVKSGLVGYQIIALASVLLLLPRLFATCTNKVFLGVHRILQ